MLVRVGEALAPYVEVTSRIRGLEQGESEAESVGWVRMYGRVARSMKARLVVFVMSVVYVFEVFADTELM